MQCTFTVPKEHLTLLDRLDWKESYIYKKVIVRRFDDSQTYNKATFMQEDEIDFLLKAITGYKNRRQNSNGQDLLAMVPIMTKKCHETIRAIYQEILSETYWRVEWDKMKRFNLYEATDVPKGLPMQSALKILTLGKFIEHLRQLY